MNRCGIKQVEQNTICRIQVVTICVLEHTFFFFFFYMFKTFHKTLEEKKGQCPLFKKGNYYQQIGTHFNLDHKEQALNM